MATYSIRADFACANPVYGQSGQSSTNSVFKTRRSLLTSLAATPFAAFALASSANAGAPNGEANMNMQVLNFKQQDCQPALGDPSKWKELVARYRAAERDLSDFDDRVHDPAISERMRRCGPRPQKKFTITTQDDSVIQYDLSNYTADQWEKHSNRAVRDAAVRLNDDWIAWRSCFATAEADLNLAELDLTLERLNDAVYAAQDAVLMEPTPHAAALLEKLEICWEEGRDGDVLREHIFRDVAHLASQGLT